MKQQDDPHHRSSDIVVGDEVLVNVRKVDRPAFISFHKLMQTYARHLRAIAAVSNNAFEVELPPELLDKRLHNVFNVSQLNKYRSQTPLLDAIDNSSDSLDEPPHLPLDEPDDLHEPIAAAETTDVSHEISHLPTQSHYDASQPTPPNSRQDVKLHPFNFPSACRFLKYKPTVDIFSSAPHHQIARYYTVDHHDCNAEGVKAFSIPN